MLRKLLAYFFESPQSESGKRYLPPPRLYKKRIFGDTPEMPIADAEKPATQSTAPHFTWACRKCGTSHAGTNESCEDVKITGDRPSDARDGVTGALATVEPEPKAEGDLATALATEVAIHAPALLATDAHYTRTNRPSWLKTEHAKTVEAYRLGRTDAINEIVGLLHSAKVYDATGHFKLYLLRDEILALKSEAKP